MDILWALPVVVASFVFQVRPRLRNRYFGIDTWRHLAVAEHYRRRRRGEVQDFDRYLIPERSDYPPLLRILLSWIPKAALDSSQWFLSPVIDAVHNVVLFCVAYQLTGEIWAAMVAQVAYALAPLIVMENSTLSTRSLASLMFTLLMISYLAFHSSGAWALVLVSVAVGTMLFLTHRMALQALLAITVALSLWFQTPYYMLVFIGSWLMAIVVSGGFYWRVFTGHLAMLWWWRRNIHNRYAHQFRGLPDKAERSGDPVFRIYQLVRSAPFIAVFAGNAFVLFPIVVALDRGRICCLPHSAGRRGSVDYGAGKLKLVTLVGVWGCRYFRRFTPSVVFTAASSGEGQELFFDAGAKRSFGGSEHEYSESKLDHVPAFLG